MEYCNNANNWPIVGSLIDASGTVGTPGGIANASWSAPGSWIDSDMLTVGCNDSPPRRGSPCAGTNGKPLTPVEERSQFTMWCLFASNLMLGSNVSAMTPSTLAIVSNVEALAINRDPLGDHGVLAYDSGSSLGGANISCLGTGALMAGNDLLVKNMTFAAARSFCLANSSCAGFTAAAGCDETKLKGGAVVQVFFKHALNTRNTDKKWSTGGKTMPRFQVFVKKMADPKTRAVAVLNRGPTTLDAQLNWTMLRPGDPTGDLKVRDIWAHSDKGIFNGGYLVKGLKSHAAALFLVTEFSL